LRISNATSATQPWLYCWEDGKDSEWLRPKEKDALTVNKYGTLTFGDLFTKIPEVEFRDTPMCYLSGVRCEESMSRYVGLTSQATYKHITWGKYLNKRLGHYTFYPIYDWTYTDVWKAIHDHKWDYCKLYDVMFQYGVPIRNMRVSNVHHETAIRSLYYMQEFEPHTWNKLTQRLCGIKMSGQLKREAYEVVKELPSMFSSWREYRDYLLANLTQDADVRKILTKTFKRMDKAYDTYADQNDMMKVQISAILANDYHGVKIGNWERSPIRHLYRLKKADPNYKIYSGAYKDALNGSGS
jgi:predicted phosphoadenosine phosphosulfate sulfurtransferase